MEIYSLSKQGWYYERKEKVDTAQIRNVIEVILLEYPYYGYKRVTKELQHRGYVCNHKKIFRIMGEYFLLQPKRKRKAPQTTNSNHNLVIYGNEVVSLGTVVPGWVWVSDITYIWIGSRWAYLALVMDQVSKIIVGWHMDISMDRSLCIKALHKALLFREPPKYHHSDRGVQYCSHDYIQILKNHNITPSMAAVGKSVDNPYAESLNRSIKVEEVYLNSYESLDEAIESIGKYVMVYNEKRLHSSLGYVSPLTFEANYKLKS